MRILVTGAAGILGTWLRRTAPDDVSLVLGVRSTPLAPLAAAPGGPPPGQGSGSDAPEQVRADLLDAEAVDRAVAAAGADLVLHTAYRHDERSVVEATQNVVAAVARHGSQLVMMSTDAVFAGDGRPRSEDEVPDPVWAYGRWKVAAEELTRSAVQDATVIRVPVLVSFDPPAPMVDSVRQAVEQGTSFTWNRGETRQAAWVSEVAAAVWRIVGLAPGERAGNWHLPGPQPLARRDLVRWVAKRLGVPDPGREVDPAPDEEWPRDLRMADERARRVIGWAPTPIIDGDDGVRSG